MRLGTPLNPRARAVSERRSLSDIETVKAVNPGLGISITCYE